MTTFSTIGQPTPLIDGKVKVTGTIRYAGDLRLPGMLHARFVTSPHAHARILKIDTREALTLPGVAAILTAQDLPDIAPATRTLLLLARERVIFVGQPVALILADNEAVAEDALDQIIIDYDPLPAAITIDQALAEDAPLVWPTGKPGESGEAAAHGADVGGEEEEENSNQKHDNIANRINFNHGDIKTGFAEADTIVEEQFLVPMVHQNALETHAVVVQIDPFNNDVNLWASTQAPFHVKQQVAKILNMAESAVRVIATPMGGAFGGKFVLYEPLIALAAQLVGQPVSLVLSRQEQMLAGNPAAPGRLRVKLGAKNDGTFTALEADITFDGGCYPSSPVGIATVLIGSIYRIPHYQLNGLEVLTFKPSTGAYRAPGAPQSAFAIESLVDQVARKLNFDPLELRLQNLAQTGDMMVHGKPWPSTGAKEVLRTLQNHPAWQNRHQAQKAGRGIGLAIGGWPGGTEPASAACTLNRDGEVEVHISTVDMSGTDTGFTLLAAEVFGVTPDKIRIVSGDTNQVPYAGAAGGSKTTYTVGPALIQAVTEARTQTLTIASDMLEAAPEDLEIIAGRVQVRGVPDSGIALSELASKTMQFAGQYAPVLGHGRHVETTQSPAFCAQLAEVEVDRETGQVQIHKLLVVQDVGRAINPMIIEGQMMGGAMQGLGWALYEDTIYDDYGQLLTASWMDYIVPQIGQGAAEMETIIVEVPTDMGPFGARGVGEPPIIPTAATIGNALADALDIRLTTLPMTPPQILAALSNQNN